ncbi:MAG: hypothetical protein LM550_10815 [Candidatus Contendobacter sp.]|jgi:hypothetical protein|nr:hypothetical protein [Gammaproteobacteria bacterium]MCC8994155.1 hypothetical protein [Candidatus Contendobacter sp.]
MTDIETKIQHNNAGNKTIAMQQELLKILGENQAFSSKGLKYLADRSLDTKYRKPLLAALTAMNDRTLQTMFPDELKKRIKTAFAFTTDVPDAAYIIISTGRRPVHDKLGWSAGNESLLKLDPIPDNLETYNEKTMQRILKTITIQELQCEACKDLMTFLLENLPKEVMPEPKEEKKKSAKIIQMHKEQPIISVSKILIDTAVVEAVQEALDETQKPVVEKSKTTKNRTKKSKKPDLKPAA